MKNLGHRVARSTIATILKREGIPPSGERPTSWRTFLRAHWRAFMAADFFTTEVWTVRGLVTYYTVFVNKRHSRRVSILGSTPHPDEAFMLQLARQLTDASDGVLGGDRKRHFLHHARLFGRCEARNGIAAFDRLVEQVMTQEPYRSARRVFWVTDNGSAHRGAKGDARLQQRWPSLIPVHTPRHASWLNQIEIYFSIVQRKVLTPNEFETLAALEHYLLAFRTRYQAIATPFSWTFTRADLHRLLTRLAGADAERPAE